MSLMEVSPERGEKGIQNGMDNALFSQPQAEGSKEVQQMAGTVMCSLNKQSHSPTSSSFFVDHLYELRGRQNYTVDDESGLRRDKEPPDRGFYSDQESSKNWADSSEDATVNEDQGIILLNQTTVNYSDCSTGHSPREKNMWLLWNDNLEVKSMLHFEQAMTVSVSYQGADPVLVTVVYGCCDLLVKEALVGTLTAGDRGSFCCYSWFYQTLSLVNIEGFPRFCSEGFQLDFQLLSCRCCWPPLVSFSSAGFADFLMVSQRFFHLLDAGYWSAAVGFSVAASFGSQLGICSQRALSCCVGSGLMFIPHGFHHLAVAVSWVSSFPPAGLSAGFCWPSCMPFLPRAFHAWMSYGLMGAGSGKVWGCRRVYEDSSLSAYAVFLDICSTLRLQAYGVRPKDKEGMIGMEFLRALKLIFFPTGSLCDVVLSVWRTLLVSLVPAGFSGNICFFNAVVGVLMLLFCCLLSGCTVHVNCFAIAADCLFQLISVGLLTGTQCLYFKVLFSSISSLSKSTAHASSPVAALLNLLVFQLVFQLVSCLYEPLSWPLYCFFGFAMKECWGLCVGSDQKGTVHLGLQLLLAEIYCYFYAFCCIMLAFIGFLSDVGISRFCSAAFLLCPSPLLTGIPAAFSYGVTAAFSDEFQLPLLSPFAAAFHASVHLITAGISAAVQLD
ncbi:unnamed protein product [Ilex paraguariensis]|uniref:Uncharacterized protein n=1 Tax=Ilex paraguariensis TaxID=185542 RepID=A0ABC8SAS0_9AQUA